MVKEWDFENEENKMKLRKKKYQTLFSCLMAFFGLFWPFLAFFGLFWPFLVYCKMTFQIRNFPKICNIITHISNQYQNSLRIHNIMQRLYESTSCTEIPY